MLPKTVATPPLVEVDPPEFRRQNDLAGAALPPAKFPSFPSPALVQAAAGLFNSERVPETVTSLRPSVEFAAKWNDYYGDRMLATARRSMVEGVRWRVEVGPGVVAVRSFDPARSERAHERAERAARTTADLRSWRGIPFVLPVGSSDPLPARSVQFWSGKSRARMVQRLSELDFTPMFAVDGRPADVTLTMPGDWLTVAPDPATCHDYLRALRKRYARTFGVPLHAIWKREFQGRGAPHWHLFCVLPAATSKGESIRDWFGRAWSEIVAHPDPHERARHRNAGVAVDFTEGARRSDPRRLAAYFSKHGSFAAKDYQNVAPPEWAGSPVGRFWGYWHLDRAVAAVEVAPDVATVVSRTARRYAASKRFYVPAEKWRKVTTVDRETGELGWRWRKRRSLVPVLRFRTAGGFLVVNDGPAFASALAHVAAVTVAHRRVRPSGAGPVGFLP